MEIVYKSEAIIDIEFWKSSGNKRVQRKISELIEDIRAHPKTGIGKPEQLKFELSGKWSRRIDRKNRIIYEIKDNQIDILSLRGHYL